MDETKDTTTDDLAARLGRSAGRFVKQATPRAKKLAEDAKPLVDKATQYAIEHQDELKAAGAKALRGRVADRWVWPSTPFANAARRRRRPRTPPPPSLAPMRAENPPNSRFCNQCAAPLS